MGQEITNKSGVELGIVPTHAGFVGGLIPDDEGRLARTDDGQIVILSEVTRLTGITRVKLDSLQLPVIPGTDEGDLDELANGLKAST